MKEHRTGGDRGRGSDHGGAAPAPGRSGAVHGKLTAEGQAQARIDIARAELVIAGEQIARDRRARLRLRVLGRGTGSARDSRATCLCHLA